MMISITMPTVNEQRLILLKEGAEQGCNALRQNLNAPHFGPIEGFEPSAWGERHLLTEAEGWEAPAAELVSAWFEQFQQAFPEYATENALAKLLGLNGKQAGRRVRAYKIGEESVPYGVWRRFLIMTGRASQEIIPVLGIFDMIPEA
ncbi:hypothetical protein ABNL11_004994 [Klebsiella pneumoniae]|nr:hypothetical protein [Klebsiella pneumoniae]ELE4368175.1 hypothetical protein [Salmonella enterica]EMD7130184.1 hypothetical protein [Salmonella enterica]